MSGATGGRGGTEVFIPIRYAGASVVGIFVANPKGWGAEKPGKQPDTGYLISAR